MDFVSRLNGCVEFKSSSPDQNISELLKVITHTIDGGGPEFPEQVLKGIGFLGADADSENFFKNYVSRLSSSELSIQYEYQHYESNCYESPDGSSHCTVGSKITIGAKSQFRISKDYVVYKKVPDVYGYCWRKN